MLAALADGGIPPTMQLPLAAVALGETAWFHVPVELFASFGLAIRERSPFPWTRVIGYTNGYFGYVADEAAHRDGVYEASASRFDARGGKVLVDAAVDLLRSLASESAAPSDTPMGAVSAMTADLAFTPAAGVLQLLVCDLDGTLLEPDGSISGRTRSAVAAVRQAGIHVAVATGRVPIGIAKVVRALDLDGPQITMHGALVRAPATGETVFSVTLGPEQVDELLQVASEIDLPVLLCYPDGFRTNDLRQEVIDLFVPFNEPLPELVGDLATLRASRPHKIAIWTGAERYQEALAIARQRLGDRYSITSGDNRSIELLAPGVDKGRAADALARWMGYSLDEVGAIGDGTNDIELLSAARRSVAMRHARPEVRDAADLVVPDDVPR